MKRATKKVALFFCMGVESIPQPSFCIRFSRVMPKIGSISPSFCQKEVFFWRKVVKKRFSGRFFRIFPEVVGKCDQAELDRDLL
jgi:hypothetical protein